MKFTTTLLGLLLALTTTVLALPVAPAHVATVAAPFPALESREHRGSRGWYPRPASAEDLDDPLPAKETLVLDLKPGQTLPPLSSLPPPSTLPKSLVARHKKHKDEDAVWDQANKKYHDDQYQEHKVFNKDWNGEPRRANPSPREFFHDLGAFFGPRPHKRAWIEDPESWPPKFSGGMWGGPKRAVPVEEEGVEQSGHPMEDAGVVGEEEMGGEEGPVRLEKRKYKDWCWIFFKPIGCKSWKWKGN